MKRYISEEDSPEHISIELGHEMGPVDVVRILGEIRESLTPQFYGIKKGGSIASDLRLRDKRLYFSCNDGNFYCLDADTGKEVWRFSAGDVMPAFETDKDTIYVSCFDHNLYALTLDGKLKWKFAAKGKLGNNPFVDSGRIYFCGEDGNVYCVDRDGKLLWKFGTASPVSAIPKVYKGRVYFGNFDGNFFALDAKTGELAWKFRCNSPTGGCEIHNDTIILPATNKILYGLDMEGGVKWTYKSSVYMAPNIASGLYKHMVFLGNRGKSVTAIDIRTGRPVWEFPTGEMTFNYTKLSGDVLYFGSCDTNFYAVDAGTGKEIWRFTSTGPNTGSTAIADDRIYFGSWDCHLYCLNRKTGKLIWKFQTSMSNMSDYEVDTRADKQKLEVTVNIPERAKSKKAKEDEVTIADYGEFSGTYIDTTKTDYLGIKKKGYVK